MTTYWLLDQHGGDGPTALVEADGSMHVIDVLRFGPGITELRDQQKIWDKVMGRIIPTMKPFAEAASVDEEGVAPLAKLRRDGQGGARVAQTGTRPGGGQGGPGVGRGGGGPSRKRSRGDR